MRDVYENVGLWLLLCVSIRDDRRRGEGCAIRCSRNVQSRRGWVTMKIMTVMETSVNKMRVMMSGGWMMERMGGMGGASK